MAPHLVRWHDELSQDGLVIIEVDNGQIDSLEELEEHISSENIPFVVLHDEDGAVCDTYGVQAYPTAYLIDRSGKVVWEGHPSGDDESRIRQLLADNG